VLSFPLGAITIGTLGIRINPITGRIEEVPLLLYRHRAFLEVLIRPFWNSQTSRLGIVTKDDEYSLSHSSRSSPPRIEAFSPTGAPIAGFFPMKSLISARLRRESESFPIGLSRNFLE
jgi:hypothetical protein